MTHVDDIVEAVVQELERTFGYLLCALVVPAADGSLDALAVRAGASARRMAVHGASCARATRWSAASRSAGRS